MRRLFLALALLLASAGASAQTSNNVLTWQAPTTYTNGTAIPSGTAITYNVLRAPSCSSTAFAAVASGITALTYTDSAASGAPAYQVQAVVAGDVSAPSNTVCVLQPNAPGSLTVVSQSTTASTTTTTTTTVVAKAHVP